jgi:hypothetical protein
MSTQKSFTAHMPGEVAAAHPHNSASSQLSAAHIMLPPHCRRFSLDAQHTAATISKSDNKARHVTLQRSKSCGDMQFAFEMT